MNRDSYQAALACLKCSTAAFRAGEIVVGVADNTASVAVCHRLCGRLAAAGECAERAPCSSQVGPAMCH